MNVHAFFDVDRTIRKGSAALDFCNFLLSKGLISNSFQKKDTKVRKLYKKGEIDYREMVDGVVTIHAETLKGLSKKELEKHYEEYIEQTNAFFSWTEEFFMKLRKWGVATTLISAGIHPAIAAIAKHLNVDSVYTSIPEEKDGTYTGQISKILHDYEKGEIISSHLANSPRNTVKIGFGDSTGDVTMLQQMDYAFIISPHQTEMRVLANKHGWTIIEEGQDVTQIFRETLNNKFHKLSFPS